MSGQKFYDSTSGSKNIWVARKFGCRDCHGTLNLTIVRNTRVQYAHQQYSIWNKTLMNLDWNSQYMINNTYLRTPDKSFHTVHLLWHTRFSVHETSSLSKFDATIGKFSCSQSLSAQKKNAKPPEWENISSIKRR